MIKQIYFLANSGAGQKATELSSLCDLLDDAGIKYDLHQVKNKKDLKNYASALNPSSYDAIVVYGGDGSVLKFAHTLSGAHVPLCILPGGTSNALAHSLGQNLSANQALKALIDGRFDLTKLDVGICNKKPFIYDLHYGLLATAIAETSRKFKQTWGSLAYAVTAISQIKDLKPHAFTLKIDTQVITANAFICYISNSGLPHFMGVHLFRSKRADDGLLDVALVKTSNFWPLFWWLIQHTWFGKGSTKSVALYRAKKITISKAPDEVFYDDTSTIIRPPLNITVKSQSLPVIVPRSLQPSQKLQSLLVLINIQIHRGLDHLRRTLTGMSGLQYSQLNDNLFIGGQPSRAGFRTLQSWGITAVISMRKRTPAYLPGGIKLLHLPTPDHQPVAINDLKKGIGFIEKEIKSGGKVYVHCHMGEGRAASMSIAYLIGQGMYLNDAISFIKQRRTFIRPNQLQLARLREFARELRKREQSKP